MDAPSIISLIAFGISLATIGVVRLSRRKPRHDASDQFICGDCPAIPDDLKLNHGRSISTGAQRNVTR